MRLPALGIVALLALAIVPPRARAQGYAPGPRPVSAAPGAYYYAPQARVAAPAPTYYVQPRATRYYAVPQRRGLLRVRKYPVTNTTYSPTILVDPNNRHWTFDYDEWMAHNF